MIPNVFFTESKTALTEEMNNLIDAVMKQNQAKEGQSSPEKNLKTPEAVNRKRKLSQKKNDTPMDQSANAAKKAPGTRKISKDKDGVARKDSEKPPAKPISNKREKEIAKAQAANEAALSFFSATGDLSQSFTGTSTPSSPPSPLQPIPTINLVGPSVSTPSPPIATSPSFSTSSPFPLSSGNFKYISSPTFTTTHPDKESSSSMLDFLNSPLDDAEEILELSTYCSPTSIQNTSPSSVGSLVKSSINVLQRNTDQELLGNRTSAECYNCNVLSKKITELERRLETLKPPREVSLYFEKLFSLETGDTTYSSEKSTDKQSTSNYFRAPDHFTSGSGKQELYAGCGVFISCVELHTILAKSIGKPQELLGQLVAYYFDDETLAKSVPLQESRTKDKSVLDQRIVHAIIVYAKKCHALCVKEEKINIDTLRFDWGRPIRNKCIMAGRRLE
ncbi:uncharacterized protein [Montipora capricornis]|uniref:uncharacterized protein n=1 Tax=Montipora capricornis TaxID=246305 RepID=UPI0035F1F0E2